MGCGSRPDAVMVAVEVVASTSILTSESDGVRVKDRSQGGPLVAGAQSTPSEQKITNSIHRYE